MSTLFRPQPDIKLVDYISTDSVSDLLQVYLSERTKLIGRAISDVANISNRLRKWIPIDAADNIIPFIYGRQTNEPLGNRIWYLSQNKESEYYHGWFFDYQISETGNRKIRRNCRLSENTLRLLEQHPEIKNNEKPE